MKYAYMLLLAFALCGCEQEPETPICSMGSDSYISTIFDCIDYSAEYTFCARPHERPNCVDFAYESTLGHCTSENICHN